MDRVDRDSQLSPFHFLAYGIAQSKLATVSEVMLMTLDEVMDLSEYLDIQNKAKHIAQKEAEGKQNRGF